MLFLTLATLLLPALTTALPQALPAGIPSCATQCLMGIATGAKECKITDPKCFCGTAALQTAFKTCIPGACSNKADVGKIITMANGQCAGSPGFPLAAPA
ncbi:hypothetical protein EJ06DRAFT_554301 [Trichodelitschia bisporula]|uniref:CFEM domain-containing protein n=1 Tax=Trichodelitschia bisporula TaxID=703511 RepID=A0A6G1I3L3_9PEZI|nr:hypothetical protein EJ06DRAFT_554301 [Trichodelitschia bisporula]